VPIQGVGWSVVLVRRTAGTDRDRPDPAEAVAPITARREEVGGAEEPPRVEGVADHAPGALDRVRGQVVQAITRRTTSAFGPDRAQR
jgi:hypothetical protein